MVAPLNGARRRPLALVGILTLAAAAALLLPRAGDDAAGAEGDEVKLFFGSPATLDPAAQSDIGTAAFTAQLYESLTAFDANLVLRPALAESWAISDDGRRIVFHLRDGIRFSDGTEITAEDVVGSWLRVIDPEAPSQLFSLLLDVEGAEAYLTGELDDPDAVGIHADGRDVVVDLERPGADFPSIVAGPTFGIVPPLAWRDGEEINADADVTSGAYTISDITSTSYVLTANEHYWAGVPAIPTVHLVDDIGGRSAVAAFEAGDLDYTGIGSFDASWIRYDPSLGPQLRVVPSLSLSFIGFTEPTPPFDDVRVRQAIAAAVDWRRLVALGSREAIPADSMIPPGIPGRPEGTWLPAYDPDRARELLAEAGYPGGDGFPEVSFATGGLGYAEGIAAEVHEQLGITLHLEELDDHFGRLHEDPPPMWTLGWVADYPGPNDFLGVLLETGSSNNYGRYSSAAFDAAINDALSTLDPDDALAAYEAALAVVRDEVPAIPIDYGDGWALARTGLLGAGQNGLGILRVAGLAWAE